MIVVDNQENETTKSANGIIINKQQKKMGTKIEYVDSNHLHATNYIRNSKAIAVLWAIFTICYAIISAVAFLTPGNLFSFDFHLVHVFQNNISKYFEWQKKSKCCPFGIDCCSTTIDTLFWYSCDSFEIIKWKRHGFNW